MIELLGYLATILFISGTASQAVKSIRDGYSDVSHGLIWSLIVGFVCMMIYTVINLDGNLVLVSSYVLQMIGMVIIGYFRYFPRPTSSTPLTEKEERLFDELIAEEESLESL